jgi:hypothetical protein
MHAHQLVVLRIVLLETLVMLRLQLYVTCARNHWGQMNSPMLATFFHDSSAATPPPPPLPAAPALPLPWAAHRQ